MSTGTTLDVNESRLFIGGHWTPARGGATLPVINPATGEAFAHVADATVEDGQAALDAACAAQDSWAATPARVRADILNRTYQGIIDRRDEFARLIVDEMGKPWAEAQTEVDYGAGFFRWFAESAGRIHTEGQYGLEPGSAYHIAVSKRPVGPSLLITPWNFPACHGRAQDRPGPGRWLHHRAQACRADPADQPAARPGPGRSRRPGRRRERCGDKQLPGPHRRDHGR